MRDGAAKNPGKLAGASCFLSVPDPFFAPKGEMRRNQAGLVGSDLEKKNGTIHRGIGRRRPIVNKKRVGP